MISHVVVFRVNTVMTACLDDWENVQSVFLDAVIATDDVWNWLESNEDGRIL
jgi:hypothetical protein